MIKQTDEWFKVHNPSIYTHGCLFLSLVATREDFSNLSHAAINAMYKGCVKLGHITDNGKLKSFVNSYDNVLKAIGSNYRWASRSEARPFCKDEVIGMVQGKVAILRIKTNLGSHFVLCKDLDTYDPYQKPASYDLVEEYIDRIDLLKKVAK
ncbi:MAG: hypothetical protein FWE37_02625 [Spirochaetaceae bacterium]|nr:hypothetical protein [Spirochaetaceae bacterium]